MSLGCPDVRDEVVDSVVQPLVAKSGPTNAQRHSFTPLGMVTHPFPDSLALFYRLE